MGMETALVAPTGDVAPDEILDGMDDAGSCCAEVGHGGFLPSMPQDDETPED